MADAVAEAPTGVARALLYIVKGSPSFLLYSSYKSFYHTFHQFGFGEEVVTTPFCGRTTRAKPGTAPDFGNLRCCGDGGILLGDQLPRPCTTCPFAISIATVVFPYLSCWFYHRPIFHCFSRCLSCFLPRLLSVSLVCSGLMFAKMHQPLRSWVGKDLCVRVRWCVAFLDRRDGYFRRSGCFLPHCV